MNRRTAYGCLLALLPHDDRLLLSPSYGWVIFGLDDDRSRRVAARRIRGSWPRMLALLLSYPLWRGAARR